MTRRLSYAYAVLPPDAPDPLGVPGLDDEPVRIVRGARLAVAVSDVDPALGDWDVAAAEPAEIARLATNHFDVVGRLFAQGTVLPLRLCTLYTSDDSALAAVEQRADPLSDALAQVSGAAQWTVRVTALADSAPETEQPASGTEYLGRLRTRRQRAAESLEARRSEVRAVLTAAAEVATSVDGPVDSGDGVSAEFLVPTPRADEFRRALGPLHESGAGSLELVGPLPPYSFVPRLEPAT